MISSYALRTVHRRGVVSSTSRIDPTVYRSPDLGYTVYWGSFWTRQADDEDIDPSAEALTLQDRSGHTRVKIVCADRCDMLDPEATVRFWSSPFYLTSFMEPGTMVAVSDHNRSAGAVMMVGPDEDGEPIVTIKETYSTGHRASVRVTLTTPLASFEEAYRMVQETLQIDQRPMFRFFGRDVLNAVLG